jgi:hypothetical protein
MEALDIEITENLRRAQIAPQPAAEEILGKSPESGFSDAVRDIAHAIGVFMQRELQNKYKVIREK